MMKVGDRVVIIGNHPHRESVGTVAEDAKKFWFATTPMFRIELDGNPDGCYAEASNLMRLKKSK